MARRIVDAGFPLALWARRQATLEPFLETAATIAVSPADVGARSDVVAVCVVADADVEQVLLGDEGVIAGMAPGGVLVIHSTIDPDTCRRLAADAAVRGLRLVDAPVSGGGVAAAERRLLVMVGGEDDAVSRCQPVFETFAGAIVHLGPVGSGQIAKLLNNLVFTAQIAVAVDTFAFAERLGLDRAAMTEVLAKGSGASFAASVIGRSGSAAGLRGAATLLRKDVDIVRDVANRRHVAPAEVLSPLAESALATLGGL
jgi:3-hydroxyisobutyrate dehydrogenase